MPNFLDVSGQRFGRLVAVSRCQGKEYPETRWHCRCDCGNEVIVRLADLRSNKTQSCGCLRSERMRKVAAGKAVDNTGQRFGRLLVLSRQSPSPGQTAAYWLCRCDCGGEIVVRGVSLRSGDVKSCGCLQLEHRRNLAKKKIVDCTGQRFGRLVALEQRPPEPGQSGTNWRCRCDCGNETVVRGGAMRSGRVRSCGCLQAEHARRLAAKSNRKSRQLQGDRFGKLVVTQEAQPKRYRVKTGRSAGALRARRCWLCRCNCGKEVTVQQQFLVDGRRTDCGRQCPLRKSKQAKVSSGSGASSQQ